MQRSGLEVADIFRDHGSAWRRANVGHISLEQLKVMSAIERCRTAALGGHVAQCESASCRHVHIAYNSCRNRHCPKCQGKAARDWLDDRKSELLPVGYFHVVFTLPKPIADIAFQNKRVIYGLLFKASAKTMLTIAADPKRLGVKLAITSVLHTWGSAMTHHPHVHMIVPGGGMSDDGMRWVPCRKGFFLPVRVLANLFRRLMLEKLIAAHTAGELNFYGNHAVLADARAFKRCLRPLWRRKWFVYAKRPFAGPKAVLAYTTEGQTLSEEEATALKELWYAVHKEDHEICEGLQRGRDSDVAVGGGVLSPHWEDSVRQFHGRYTGLFDKQAFDAWLAPLRKPEWVVYAKPPFGGPEAVLAYLSRYTHRVAISNRRLIKADAATVSFRCKNYRVEGPDRYTTMMLATDEFIRRFLLHVLPKRFHRIRHYGLLANGNRAANIAKARKLLSVTGDDSEPGGEVEERTPDISPHPCPRCGGSMRVIETFKRGCEPTSRGPP